MRCKFCKEGICRRDRSPYKWEECPVTANQSICVLCQFDRKQPNLKYKCGSCKYAEPYNKKDGDTSHIWCTCDEIERKYESARIKARSAPGCKTHYEEAEKWTLD